RRARAVPPPRRRSWCARGGTRSRRSALSPRAWARRRCRRVRERGGSRLCRALTRWVATDIFALMATAAPVTRLFIGGGGVGGGGGGGAEGTSPAPGESLGPVAQGDRDDARRAIDAARDAFPKWASATAF